jgi:hypothetical protein
MEGRRDRGVEMFGDGVEHVFMRAVSSHAARRECVADAARVTKLSSAVRRIGRPVLNAGAASSITCGAICCRVREQQAGQRDAAAGGERRRRG